MRHGVPDAGGVRHTSSHGCCSDHAVRPVAVIRRGELATTFSRSARLGSVLSSVARPGIRWGGSSTGDTRRTLVASRRWRKSGHGPRSRLCWTLATCGDGFGSTRCCLVPPPAPLPHARTPRRLGLLGALTRSLPPRRSTACVSARRDPAHKLRYIKGDVGRGATRSCGCVLWAAAGLGGPHIRR